jgi:hypothetical protein
MNRVRLLRKLSLHSIAPVRLSFSALAPRAYAATAERRASDTNLKSSHSAPKLNLESYLGPSLALSFLISGLSYRITFNSEFRISSFPLYSI